MRVCSACPEKKNKKKKEKKKKTTQCSLLTSSLQMHLSVCTKTLVPEVTAIAGELFGSFAFLEFVSEEGLLGTDLRKPIL